jgi:hypothetical protein
MATQKTDEPNVDQDAAGVKPDTKAPDEPFLGTWKTKEAAEEGLSNLQKILDSQGNELGTLRKQTEFFQRQLEGLQQTQAKPKPEAPKGPDYGQELKAVQKEKASLDPDEPGYQAAMAKLDAKALSLVREQTKQEVLLAAQAEFKNALDERDIQSMHKDFYRQNPDFSTPDMQMRIQEYLANDQTGMSDPMVAYREIQRDDALAERARLEQENAEIKRLLDLKKGEELTGKVVTKGQSPAQQQTKQPKATGADLDRGMMEALQRAKGA